mmetsp:Transcript_50487/g.131356  ORF Transcript_50487/g.131356 Transcript_50487/m.131356 type:complete len:213 (-) Transcript_50487:458-1096(-)
MPPLWSPLPSPRSRHSRFRLFPRRPSCASWNDLQRLSLPSFRLWEIRAPAPKPTARTYSKLVAAEMLLPATWRYERPVKLGLGDGLEEGRDEGWWKATLRTPRAPSTRASSRADCSSVPSTDCFLRIDFSLTPRKRSHDGQRTSQAAYTQPSMASMSRVLDSLMLARARHRVNAESSRETSHTRSRSATASCGRASHAPVDKDVMQYEQRLA